MVAIDYFDPRMCYNTGDTERCPGCIENRRIKALFEKLFEGPVTQERIQETQRKVKDPEYANECA